MTKLTTIQVTDSFRKKLMIMKQKLGCKTVEELLDKVLKIAKATELDKK